MTTAFKLCFQFASCAAPSSKAPPQQQQQQQQQQRGGIDIPPATQAEHDFLVRPGIIYLCEYGHFTKQHTTQYGHFTNHPTKARPGIIHTSTVILPNQTLLNVVSLPITPV
jgi:hypothetical protein